MVKPWFFVTFNVLISYIFPEAFIEIPQVVQKISRFSSSILTNFYILDFLTFLCYNKNLLTPVYNKQGHDFFIFNLL